jgi:hypothetical protein
VIPDGTYTAVVDRIEEGLAALEVERSEAVDELVVEATALPAGARRADAVLTVELADGELVGATHDASTTATRRRELQDRFDRLSSRLPDDEDETNDR